MAFLFFCFFLVINKLNEYANAAKNFITYFILALVKIITSSIRFSYLTGHFYTFVFVFSPLWNAKNNRNKKATEGQTVWARTESLDSKN